MLPLLAGFSVKKYQAPYGLSHTHASVQQVESFVLGKVLQNDDLQFLKAVASEKRLYGQSPTSNRHMAKKLFFAAAILAILGAIVGIFLTRSAPLGTSSSSITQPRPSGQYQTAVVDGGFMYVSSDYGVNWTPTASEQRWTSISLSSSGQHQTALVYGGQIYVSSNYGGNWTARGTTCNWNSVSLSSSGQYQTAVVFPGQIYSSSDFGGTWTARATNHLNWADVSLSSSGQYQTAVASRNIAPPGGLVGSEIYSSSDYGVTWTERLPARAVLRWLSVSLSSSGQYQTAVACKFQFNSDVFAGQIYVSADYGGTWAARATSEYWVSVSISSSGQYQTAISQSFIPGYGQIHVSSDYGNTWNTTASYQQWWAVSLSSSGQHQVAIVIGGQIYVSSDYGVTWTARATSQHWSSVRLNK